MEYIHGTTEFELAHTAVTLGKFDGVHKGHRLLIEEVAKAKKEGLTSCVFSFDLHPGSLFSEREMDLIYTEEEKRRLLEQLSVDCFLSYPFTKETSSMEPEEFIKNILVGQLHAKRIVVGTDYRFGKGRRGDVKLLSAFADRYGYVLTAEDKLTYEGSIISSSRIREELRVGNLVAVNAMLGAPYSITGTVVDGKKLGRTIGFPTINQEIPDHKLLPPNGVYASVVTVEGRQYYGVTNIGCKPTVKSDSVKGAETHLFSYDGNLYGKEAVVALYSFERPEQKFPSVEALREQLARDIKAAKRYFELHNVT